MSSAEGGLAEGVIHRAGIGETRGYAFANPTYRSDACFHGTEKQVI